MQRIHTRESQSNSLLRKSIFEKNDEGGNAAAGGDELEAVLSSRQVDFGCSRAEFEDGGDVKGDQSLEFDSHSGADDC